MSLKIHVSSKCWDNELEGLSQNKLTKRQGGLVSKETVVLRRWGSDTRKFGLSTELIM